MNKLSELVEITQYYGRKKDFVIAGGGNTSFKTDDRIWVKASGVSMGDITAEGFAELDRRELKIVYTRNYSSDSLTRESEVKADLYKACVHASSVRPSVETSLHEIINYPYVVHTHPTLVNAITCSQNADKTIHELFGNSVLYIPYTDPGYILFTRIHNYLNEWRTTNPDDPKIIFLQNHGVFVSGHSPEEIRKIYDSIEATIKEKITDFPDCTELEVPHDVTRWLPALRMMLSDHTVKLARIINNRLIGHFTSSESEFSAVSQPFTPDQIVYCKAYPMYLEACTPAEILSECQEKLKAFVSRNGYFPRILGVKGYGLVALGENIRSVKTSLDVFIDWMQIAYMTEKFGGPHHLSDRDVAFIDNWEVENYRRKVGSGNSRGGKVENKIAVVTGGAQGFGEGISECLVKEGANVVIGDINTGKGKILADRLNTPQAPNEAVFSVADVTDKLSVQNLIYDTVKTFGGIDILISNAGILRAGSLEEMDIKTFEDITRVNYTGYYICTGLASEIMKLQSSYRDKYFTDIIQINSKSGLRGSNRNFAYAGSKFGGIGLTQSFALELIPWYIKVNSVCPGNFFDGPLWNDPETGLFVQYLRTGKVPGAKTIADVKVHYEKQVPAGRGCRVEDVMKAIFYIIDQEYETGQALPVTGGQEMLR